MKPFRSFFILVLFGLYASGCASQIRNPRTAQVQVNGNCGMCETTIESAALVTGEAAADWNVDTKVAQIIYDSSRTDLDAILKRIAHAGYDNDRFLAPDAVYAALPGCCRYERVRKQPTPATAQGNHDDHTGHTSPASGEHIGHNGSPAVQSTDPIASVFAHYFALKDALVASDAALAKKHAGELDGTMHSITTEDLPEEVNAIWARVMEGAMPTLHPLSESNDLAEQRTLFAKLTAPLLQLAEAAPQDRPIYLDHCPMYEGGADWLSQEKAIKNPFYGSAMLTCGSVKATVTK